ncbi:hypothetical protein [Leptolyngbya sp. FACHB-16]|nr:hypothetical protein [Leptolyngbya sp. FACHB-16]MBD2156862.1 hypothetical protein [Leptolyngbya sp. FACHB-16]
MPVSVEEGRPQQQRKWGQWTIAGGIFGLMLLGAIAQMQQDVEKDDKAKALKEAVILTRRTYQTEFTNDPNKPTFLGAYQAYGAVEVSLEANGKYAQLIDELPTEGKIMQAQAWCRTDLTEKIAPIEIDIVLLNARGGVLAAGMCP